MQSLVLAFGVFFNHSSSIDSNSAEGTGAPPGTGAFLFFCLGTCPFAEGRIGVPGNSSALRFRLAFRFASPPSPATGLVERLPINCGCPASGLFPRLVFEFLGLGTLGLVARLATMECPPCEGESVGDAAREPGAPDGVMVTAGRGGASFGVCARDCDCDSIFCCCSWMADAAVGTAVGSSSSSSSCRTD